MNSGDFLKGATIGWDRIWSEPDVCGSMVFVFELRTSSGDYQFDATQRFAENGNDFSIWVRLFGYLGTQMGCYKSFTANEIGELKRFLNWYFATQDIPVFTSMNQGRRAVEVLFRKGWVIEGDGALYESDGVTFHRRLGKADYGLSRPH
jgi:hypothetical protein